MYLHPVLKVLLILAVRYQEVWDPPGRLFQRRPLEGQMQCVGGRGGELAHRGIGQVQLRKIAG